MTTTITYHGSVTDDAHGRDRHDVRLTGSMARSVETWFVRHADAVRSPEQGVRDEIRLDVFDPPTGWLGRSQVRDILLRVRLERPCAGGMAYVDLRGGHDPRDEVVDLRRL
ncbi:hypothetical protein MKK58_20090 [Methylobacterium sp. J-078]|jgi:hypothetical protein|uniref:hypothetical protein n=1 Tax=Methylobacterium sp. J-078 TaxID=2836657 RepID=UPI001FB984FA|nr:hypothetical protein [Methylobacterium sp. J-078]MCJ2046819.1 hypothetical protein [Methylobacterium sp. J-078]